MPIPRLHLLVPMAIVTCLQMQVDVNSLAAAKPEFPDSGHFFRGEPSPSEPTHNKTVPPQNKPARPNILYFYVDDMGWGSIGPNGQARRREQGLPVVLTPNLDRLAAAGVNFTRGYGCHVCSPARSSQQTGFHQGHTFADRNDPNNARKAIRADDPSIGKSLSAAGYTTGYWGKWGYGGSKEQRSPKIDNVQTLPTSHGYEYVLAELHHVRAHTFFQPTLWSAPASPGSLGGIELVSNTRERLRSIPDLPLKPSMHNHADYPKTAYCDDAYAFAALQFVQAQAIQYNQTGQPFLGILAVQIPHAPFGEVSTLPDWDQAYAADPHFAKLAEQSKQWAAMVTRIDQHFGNILDALEDPNGDGDTSDSVAANTVVVFQSDNGGPRGRNNEQFDANGGLRGTKGSIQEGGIRVPLVMRWPAKIHAESPLKAGSSVDTVVDVTDLFPTFCELAGAPRPLGIDGVSIAPTLTGEGLQRRRDFIIHEASNGQSIIRGNMKLVRSRKSTAALYDLSNDPTEAENIASQHPEIVRQLEELLIGERVTEPKGFANTYHRWTGADGANTSEAGNWSDYQYSNAGIVYMQDRGAPQKSWVATIANGAREHSTAIVDANLEILALQIAGNPVHGVEQIVELGEGVSLVGRNEVRVAELGRLSINDSTVRSLRWIDIEPGGTVSGTGELIGTTYNSGTLEVPRSSEIRKSLGGIQVVGDYHQSDSGRIVVAAPCESQPCIQITGTAHLAGSIELNELGGGKIKSGATLTLLSASRLTGKFAESKISIPEGLELRYTDTSVIVAAK